MSAASSDSRVTYRIFVSFASTDRELAEYLATGLRRNLGDFDSVYCFSKPGRYNSKGRSRPTDNFIQLIDERLKKCNVFLLLWSVHARGSTGVMYELNQAKHYYMKHVKRLGKEFKILPIRINKCGPPLGLTSTVYINYSTGDNQQDVLNQVLEYLGYPPENDHPSVIVVKQAIFELRMAFRNKDWQAVIRQYPNIFGLYPRAISATTHYMYAIALIKQGQVAESLIKMREGLSLTHQGQDADLLYAYAQCLKERWRWNDVRFLAEKADILFPYDTRWQQLIFEAFGNSSNTLSSFPYAQTQSSSQLNQAPHRDANGTVNLLLGNQNASLPYLQQIPPLSQIDISPLSHEFSSAFTFNSPPDPVTEQLQLSPDELSRVTKRLSDEELQPEVVTGFSSKAKYFIRNHFSHHKLKRLLSMSLLLAAFLNSLCLLLITLVWPFTTTFMGYETVAIVLVLCVGRMIEATEVKFLCISIFCILWVISGYCLGISLLDWLGLNVSTSIHDWIKFICIIGVMAVVLPGHIRLFYDDK